MICVLALLANRFLVYRFLTLGRYLDFWGLIAQCANHSREHSLDGYRVTPTSALGEPAAAPLTSGVWTSLNIWPTRMISVCFKS